MPQTCLVSFWLALCKRSELLLFFLVLSVSIELKASMDTCVALVLEHQNSASVQLLELYSVIGVVLPHCPLSALQSVL